jgi:hypothetical protein
LRAFSSYILVQDQGGLGEDIKISSGDIPVTYPIDENAPEFKLCIAIFFEINTGRVDYAIKKILDNLLEEIICITEGKQNQATMGICQNLLQRRSACDVGIIFTCLQKQTSRSSEANH